MIHTTAAGRELHSTLPRPFVVVRPGAKDRRFATIEAARRAAPGGSRIFFERSLGIGTFVEYR